MNALQIWNLNIDETELPMVQRCHLFENWSSRPIYYSWNCQISVVSISNLCDAQVTEWKRKVKLSWLFEIGITHRLFNIILRWSLKDNFFRFHLVFRLKNRIEQWLENFYSENFWKSLESTRIWEDFVTGANAGNIEQEYNWANFNVRLFLKYILHSQEPKEAFP